VKIFVVLDLIALGYLNWKVFGPRAMSGRRRAKLINVAIAEAALGFVLVLAITRMAQRTAIPGSG
jgi:hypothetical protein